MEARPYTPPVPEDKRRFPAPEGAPFPRIETTGIFSIARGAALNKWVP
jgi:hypothetical protein